MAKLFQVNVPDGVSSVKLDSQGRATVQYTVKNVSARQIDGRAVLISLPQVKPASGPVEKGWVKLDGTTDRHFDVDKEETFTVKILVPPKSPSGNYTFRLDAVWVDKPDIGDSSPVIGFTVAAPVVTTGHFPLWLIPVILVVVLGVGVGLYFALKPKGPTVPDLAGKTVPEATKDLADAKLTLDPNIETIQSKPEDSDKVVAQEPAAGGKAKEGTSVHLKVGAEVVKVPLLVGHPYAEAQTMLASNHLAIGQVKNENNPNVAGGVVFAQSPDPGNSVLSGSTVNLSVTPQTVPVPVLTGMLVGQAVQKLQQVGLQLGTLTGDQISQPVTAQNPPSPTAVAVGSKVNLVVPSSNLCVPFRCVFSNNAARLMTQPMRAHF
jgi:beta-lactam-binding protein with PASTA domain